jgi:SET domain-containing protein
MVSAVYPLRIARSRIHRWGVFAVGSIPRGRKVIEYTGERISPTEACARVNRLLRPGRPKRTYLFRLNRLWTIDGAIGGSGAERINHSCDPNLFYRRTRGHILLFSLRRIRPGEELSYDYRLVSNSLRVPCRCGSPNCRGFLNCD